MKKILFYCSWGGFGHIARAYAVSRFLENNKVYVASAQPWIFSKPKYLKYIKLNEPYSRFRFEGEKIVLQNYLESSNDVAGYRKHLLAYLNLLDKIKPDVVVVDNPAEIAIFTKMLGYKTCIVYETLETDDLRWRLAWKNADKILIPYPKQFPVSLKFNYWDNTFISGGYTRFEGNNKTIDKWLARKKYHIPEDKNVLLLTVGKGNKARNVLDKVIPELSDKFFALLPIFTPTKADRQLEKRFANLKIVANVTDLSEYYLIADVVVTGSGYNSVMEAFEHRVPVIAFALERIYGEQISKATILEQMGAIKYLDFNNNNWRKQLIDFINELTTNKNVDMIRAQEKIVDGTGARKTAEMLKELIK